MLIRLQRLTALRITHRRPSNNQANAPNVLDRYFLASISTTFPVHWDLTRYSKKPLVPLSACGITQDTSKSVASLRPPIVAFNLLPQIALGLSQGNINLFDSIFASEPSTHSFSRKTFVPNSVAHCSIVLLELFDTLGSCVYFDATQLPLGSMMYSYLVSHIRLASVRYLTRSTWER